MKGVLLPSSVPRAVCFPGQLRSRCSILGRWFNGLPGRLCILLLASLQGRDGHEMGRTPPILSLFRPNHPFRVCGLSEASAGGALKQGARRANLSAGQVPTSTGIYRTQLHAQAIQCKRRLGCHNLVQYIWGPQASRARNFQSCVLLWCYAPRLLRNWMLRPRRASVQEVYQNTDGLS